MYAQHEHKTICADHAVLVGLIPLTTYRIQFINKEDYYHMTIFLFIIGIIVTAAVVASFVLSWLIIKDIGE